VVKSLVNYLYSGVKFAYLNVTFQLLRPSNSHPVFNTSLFSVSSYYKQNLFVNLLALNILYAIKRTMIDW